MNDSTHYDTLNVPFGASQELIKSAYKNKAKEIHPDHHPPEDRERYRTKFRRLQKAYRILSDPRERALYDRNLAQSGLVSPKDEAYWTFWRQFLADNPGTKRTLSYHEKMVMDSYAEDWLEERYGGEAKDRRKFRKFLNFGKLHLSQNNQNQAMTEFIRAENYCMRNILSKFYVGYCHELKGNFSDALERFKVAVRFGLDRPPEYVNKCLTIRQRIVDLYQFNGETKKAREQEKIIRELKNRRDGFDQFLDSEPPKDSKTQSFSLFTRLLNVFSLK